MATDNVLAIDQGTSATKAIVLSAGRGILGRAERRLHPSYGPGGLAEQEPAELLASVLDAGQAALQAAGEPVSAIGIANQGETVLAWDPGSGKALTPAVVWQDRRASGVCRDLAPAAKDLQETTGLPLDPYFAAPKMTWLRRNLTREGVVTTSDSWLLHQLTGAFVTDITTASRTMLLDLRARSWAPGALETFGLTGEPMPQLADCGEPVGETKAFGYPVQITGLAVDQQAALFAQGCLTAGTAKCTYGTGVFLLANTGPQPVRSRAGLPASVAWQFGDTLAYCLDGQVYTGASAVDWLVRMGILTAAADLDACAATVPDAGGVRFLPALSGLGAPWWRSDVRGSIRGIALDISPGHIVRALIDGIAAQVAAAARAACADTGMPLVCLRVDGGLSRSRALMQTQADLLQIPVEVYASPDATALGAAALARLGAGLAPAAGDALERWQPAAVYEPAITAGEAASRLGDFEEAVTEAAGERA